MYTISATLNYKKIAEATALVVAIVTVMVALVIAIAIVIQMIAIAIHIATTAIKKHDYHLVK